MRVLVSGATGFIGTQLVRFLATKEGEVVRLVRRESPSGSREIPWNPETGSLEASRLEGFDVVVHLAGEPIAAGRWTPEKKRRIQESRVQGTRLLSQALSQLSKPPQLLICASAIGFYGDRGDELLNENSPAGKGFLPEVAQGWEGATEIASQKGIRVLNLRLGIVLWPTGGAIKMMLPPFQLGLGGKLGSGRQIMSWISLKDVIGIIHYAFANPNLKGPVNAVSPHPVTNLEFTKTLGRVLKRPTLFPVPAFAVRLLFGEMGEDLLLSSTRVEPAFLKANVYPFFHPTLEEAFREMFGSPPRWKGPTR